MSDDASVNGDETHYYCKLVTRTATYNAMIEVFKTEDGDLLVSDLYYYENGKWEPFHSKASKL